VKLFIACGLFLLASVLQGQVLFDATKAEMAGNADWVIDADAHDLRVESGDGSGRKGSGDESDPQRIPTPSITAITAGTAETYWNGSLSAWAVALAKHGVSTIETLPVFISPSSSTRSRITYGDSTNAQDLSHYRLFVVCEPNIAFTAAEKTAILSYVHDGGRLFIVSDHDQSDRNNDGIDAVGVWNGLLGSPSVLGFTFNLDNVSPTGSADSTSTDPVTHGVAGTVTSLKFNNGATMTITNASQAHAAVWESSSHSSSQVLALYGTYGSGKFVAVGDSSPIDDGTGDPNDIVFDGWDDSNGNDGRLVTNASMWLLRAVPIATTNGATAVSSAAATLNGSVDPRFGATTAQFQYGLDTSYGQTTASQNVGSGDVAVAVTVSVSGLLPNTAYHFRVVATNPEGTVNGTDMTFTTMAAAPSVTTSAPSNNHSTASTLNGSVSPNGTATTYHFDFGTDKNYGFSSPEQIAGSASSSVPVALDVNGLAPGTTYHYRVTITSTFGTNFGNDVSFTTAAFIDSDGDGMPDDYETASNLNPGSSADAALDSDGDGVSNLAEYRAGTNPRDPSSVFRVNSVATAGSDVTIWFGTVFGKRYQVESSSDLTAVNWLPVGKVINGNGASSSVVDPGGLTNPVNFYRVRIVP
jgi:hypothetical protein